MRAVVQRLTSASVSAAGYSAEVGRGFLVLLGIGRSDDAITARGFAGKIATLRVFEDRAG